MASGRSYHKHNNCTVAHRNEVARTMSGKDKPVSAGDAAEVLKELNMSSEEATRFE